MKAIYILILFYFIPILLIAQGVQTVSIVNGTNGFCPGNSVTINFTVTGTPASSYRVRLIEIKSATSLEPSCPLVSPRPSYDATLLSMVAQNLSHTFGLPTTMNEVGHSSFSQEVNALLSSDDPCKIVDFEITTVGYRVEVEPIPNFNNTPIRTANITINNCTATPLPVNYLHFIAKETQEGISLNWATSNEQANSYFEIEYANEVQNFEVIGQVKGHNNSKENQYYSFMHKNPREGINYYRLKQVDIGGKAKYSKILAQKWFENPKIDLMIYPNPIENKVIISTSNNLKIDALFIHQLDGKLVKIYDAFETGENENIDLSFLNTGVFVVVANVKGKKIVQKIIKK